MPLCRPLLRPLLHSRALPPCRLPSACPATCSRYQPSLRNNSTAVQKERQNGSLGTNNLDLSKVPSDSAYLDFILGPGEEVSAPNQDTQQALASQEVRGEVRVERPLPIHPKEPGKSDLASKHRGSTREKARQNVSLQARSSVRRRAAFSRASTARWRSHQEFHRLRSQGVRLRSKFVSIRSGTQSRDHFSRYWNANFASIQAAFDDTFDSGQKAALKPPKLHSRTSDWVHQVLEHFKNTQDPSQVYHILHEDPKRAISRWQSVALWFLYHDPKSLITLLEATETDPGPPLSCLEDCLQYLAKYFTSSKGVKDLKELQKLPAIFVHIANQRAENRMWMTSSFFRLLLPHCTDEQIGELYRTIKLQHVNVSWHTYLHFATYFARHDHFEQALDAVLESRNVGAALDSYAFRSNCATLLRTAIRQPGGLRVTMRIVANLVKIGLPLNTRLCNIVMLNAVEAGDLRTAFSVYHSLVEHGLQADVHTHSILLKGCKANIDDAETLNTTIRNAIDGLDIHQHIILATEILHCLALHHSKHNPETAYATVFDAYTQLFESQPIQRMGLPLPKPSQTSEPAKAKLQPNHYVMNIMLATFLDHHFVHNRSTAPAHELYQQIRTLIAAGEEPFNLLAKTDYTANIFLKSFTRTRKGLLYAAEVMKDMQKALPSSANVVQCPPTVQSWSIFLHGFTRHGQLQLAEQVLNFMRVQGVQPNHVTWTSLIAGYAGAQDLDRALDAVRQGEVDGAVWDEWTVSGLRRLVDQKRLHEEIRKRRLAASLDFSSELRDGLGARLSTVTTEFGAEADSFENRR